MTKRSDINVTMTFHPKEGTQCGYCGICSFAHRHKAGTLPKDFERIDEASNTTQGDIEMALENEFNNNIHSNESNIYPKMTFTEEELKLMEDFLGDIFCCGGDYCDGKHDKKGLKLTGDFLRQHDDRLLERVKKEVIGEDEDEVTKIENKIFNTYELIISAFEHEKKKCRNILKSEQRAKLKEIGAQDTVQDGVQDKEMGGEK